MNKKNTKRSLGLSLLCLLLCLTMLIGSTFAWFTDNASTAVNTIQAGTLKLKLEMSKDGGKTWEDAAGKTLDFLKAANAPAGEQILWEPGVTYNLPTLRITNDGNLALKYKVEITGIKGDAELNEVIDWTYNGFAADTEYNLAPAASQEIKISGHMQEAAGNDYMGLTIEGAAITVYATQYTSEYDSINNTYDAGATYGEGVTPPANENVTAGTAGELAAAIDKALDGGSVSGVITITLDKDFDMANGWTTITGKNYSGVNNVVIDGAGHSIKNLNQPLMEGVFGGSGSLEIKNLTIKDSTISAAGGAGVGIGAFVNNADASSSVTFTNCKVENVNITNTADDSTLGGFIGYSSAATLTFTNCSVTGSTLTGTKDIGAFVGYTQSAVTATGVTITGNTINSSNTSTYRVGAIAGTFNSNPSTITTTNVSGNTISQPNAADMSKHTSDYAGRIYADVTVDGVALAKNN